MSSRILFLGTGGDCFTVGKQSLGSGGIIVESGSVKLHIDPGPGSLNRARVGNINLRDLTAVISTHNHIGHCNDLNAVISAMTFNGFDKKGVLIANKSILEGVSEEKPMVSEFHKKCVERVIPLDIGSKVGIEDVEIIATDAKHADPNAVGLKISTPEFVIGYTSDTEYSEHVSHSYKDCNILILNVQYPAGTPDNEKVGGMSCDDAVKFIKDVNPRLAIMTHFGIKLVKADPLIEAREVQRLSGVQTVAAKEGMQINPNTYSKS